MEYVILWLSLTLLLFYMRASAPVWAIVTIFVYLTIIKYVEYSFVKTFISALLLIFMAFYIKSIRIYLFKVSLGRIKETIPKISQTEKEAIDAGECGFEKQILQGKPKWRELHMQQYAQLTKEEQSFVAGPVNELLLMLNDWEIMQNSGDLPEPIWEFIKANGFLGMIIPKEYGGLGFSTMAIGQIFTNLYARSTTAATTISVPNSLGPGELLVHYGTQQQRDYYLPRLANGEEIPCFALTSAYAGSDASSMIDNGVVCYGNFKGKKVIGINLNWQKRYITLAPIATLLGLAFKLFDPDNILGDKTNIGITCALIPTNLEGVEIGNRHNPMHTPFHNGPTSGKDVFIPLDYVIGGEEMIGKGWRMLMENLATGRAISLPASALGLASHVLAATSSYVVSREQFNLPIGKFEGVQESVAKIVAYTYMIDATYHFTISTIQSGVQAAIASAICKYHTTELSRKIINYAMDIHGGKGICIGPRNYLFAGYQGTPIGITVEGSNILTRSLIIFGQGLIRCHPYVLDELDAIKKQDYKKLDNLICKHSGYFLYNFSRSVVYSMTAGYFIKSPSRRLKKYYKRMSKYSIHLAFVSDLVLLIYQGSFKRKESLSGRLADVLSYIYMGSSVLKKYYEEGESKEEIYILEWVMDDICYTIEQKFYDIIGNLPNVIFRKFIHLLLFPYGKYSRIPTDNLDKEVCNLVMKPSKIRDRLTRYAYYKGDNNPLSELKDLFELLNIHSKLYGRFKSYCKKFQETEKNIFNKLELAVKEECITEKERDILLKIENLRQSVIKVDDFSPDEFREL